MGDSIVGVCNRHNRLSDNEKAPAREYMVCDICFMRMFGNHSVSNISRICGASSLKSEIASS